jgi:retinol dehydrogenase-12
VEYARRYRQNGIVSVAVNPGNVRTQLARDQGLALKIVAHAVVYPVDNGVYTQLYAAFSYEVAHERRDWTREWGE